MQHDSHHNRRSLLYNVFSNHESKHKRNADQQHQASTYDPIQEKKQNYKKEFLNFIEESQTDKIDQFKEDNVVRKPKIGLPEPDQASLHLVKMHYEKALKTIRRSNVVEIENLHTKYKSFVKEIIVQRCMKLRELFERECQELMRTSLDLRSKIIEKDIQIKELQIIISSVELQGIEKERQVNLVHRHETLPAYKQHQAQVAAVVEDKISLQIKDNQKLRFENERLQELVNDLQEQLAQNQKNASSDNQQILEKKSGSEHYERIIKHLKSQLHLANVLKGPDTTSREENELTKQLRSQLLQLKTNHNLHIQKTESQIKHLEEEVTSLKDELKREKTLRYQLEEQLGKSSSNTIQYSREAPLRLNTLDDFIIHPSNIRFNVDHYYESPKVHQRPKFCVTMVQNLLSSKSTQRQKGRFSSTECSQDYTRKLELSSQSYRSSRGVSPRILIRNRLLTK